MSRSCRVSGCGSYAINPHCYDRDDADLDLCDVHYWMKRARPVPNGWVLVPVEPTEAMEDAGRNAVMARECSGPGFGAGDHYEACGHSTSGIPDELLRGKGKMTKGHCAHLVWASMLAAQPEPPK